MASADQSAPVSKGLLWAGRIISALPALFAVKTEIPVYPAGRLSPEEARLETICSL